MTEILSLAKNDIDRDISLDENDIDRDISLAENDIDRDISLAKNDRVNNNERVNNRIKKNFKYVFFLLTKPLSASAETPSLWLQMILTEISLWLKMILTERVKSRIRTSKQIIH